MWKSEDVARRVKTAYIYICVCVCKGKDRPRRGHERPEGK